MMNGVLGVTLLLGLAAADTEPDPNLTSAERAQLIQEVDAAQDKLLGLISGMTDEQVYVGVEKALRKYFGKRGERVVQDNMTCVKRGYKELQEVPQQLIQR